MNFHITLVVRPENQTLRCCTSWKPKVKKWDHNRHHLHDVVIRLWDPLKLVQRYITSARWFYPVAFANVSEVLPPLPIHT